MTEPLHAHWVATKHVLRYLYGKINLGLGYTTNAVRLHGYTDVVCAENVIDRKRKKQKFISLSTVEVEYIVSSMASCEALCLRKLFRELFEQVLDTMMIYCNNKSGI